MKLAMRLKRKADQLLTIRPFSKLLLNVNMIRLMKNTANIIPPNSRPSVAALFMLTRSAMPVTFSKV